MKKSTLLILLMCATSYLFAQFPEKFNSGTSDTPEGWVSFIGDNGAGTAKNWSFSDTGEYAFLEPEDVSPETSEDWLVSPQFMVDGDSYNLSFRQMDFDTADNGSVYTIRISNGSQTNTNDFTTIATYYESDMQAAVFNPYYIDLSEYAGQNIYIAFVMEQQNGDYWYLDDINVTGNMSIPKAAENPTPYDTETNVVVNNPMTVGSIDMSWSAATTGDPASYYKIYFGESATELNYIGTISETSYTMNNCEDDTNYYWKVVPTNVAGDAIDVITWSFSTGNDTSLANDVFKDSMFEIYPNPASDFLHIKSKESLDQVQIVNQVGKQVMTLTTDHLNEFENSINIADLERGIYYVTVSSEGNVSSYKIVKS
ncbi:Por secretion system C-terminal sorting domain-containing protein [Pustulibacterium marinum]|uniref:Por secretion system C-terminal sorting domain-containing protein n=1 Tax=Pustulibacterium marinum TaxID=1224947 RepID=A0A1I7GN54_9FLAO|nr:choice-of-anchor J domain-containing protein [Pustulibacterium marinum]SFU49696.1 Por secretion system C-terminal sorting domain-containing protein [Pustulibacterium marinum]